MASLMSLILSSLLVVPALTFAGASEDAPAPDTSVDCGELVCLYARDRKLEPIEAGSWQADKRLSQKRRRKEAKKNRRRKKVGVSVALEGARGSAFIDGRYIATAGPHSQRMLHPGRHEVEVRDGPRVIAYGILVVPRNVASIAVVVRP